MRKLCVAVTCAVAAFVLVGCAATSGADTSTSGADTATSGAARLPRERQTRQDAAREVKQALASAPVPDGARRVPAKEVPPLARSTSFLSGPNKSVTRSGFWLVPTHAKNLARWYAVNPPHGMSTEGGPHGVGGSRNSDGSWSYEVAYNGLSHGEASHSSALVDVTPVADQSGVRVTVYSYWQPARHPRSFASQDVTTARIVVTRDRHRKVVTVSKAEEISRLVRTYDSLPGTHALPHSCPLILHTTTYRLTLISPKRELSALLPPSCDSAWWIHLDGKPLRPALENDGLAELIDDLVS
jgi:hypothetical protein